MSLRNQMMSQAMRLAIIMLSLCFTGYAQASNYYMYKDEQGNMVMRDSIPPEYTQQGYRIVNERGMTIEVVEPVKEDDEAGLTPEQKQELARRREAEENRDKTLLHSFNTVEDIERAMENKLAALQGLIDVTEFNVQTFESNLESLRNRARMLESREQEVPEKLSSDIKTVEQNIHQNLEYIARKRSEMARVEKQYRADIARFIELGNSSRQD